MNVPESKKISTGIPSLDRELEKGVPPDRIAGEPRCDCDEGYLLHPRHYGMEQAVECPNCKQAAEYWGED